MKDETKGSIDGKRNRRLRMLFLNKKKKEAETKAEELKEKEEVEKKKKELANINKNSTNEKSEKHEEKEITIPINNKEKNENVKLNSNSKQNVSEIKPQHINSNFKKKFATPDISQVIEEVKIVKDDLVKKQEQTKSEQVSKIGIEKEILNNKQQEKNKEQEPKKEIREEDKKGISEKIKDVDKQVLSKRGTIKVGMQHDVNQEKNLLELALVNEFEVILEDHRYDLNNLIVDFNILNKQVDKAIETDELEKIYDEIEELVEKLEIIKRELELLTNSATFKDIYKLHDPYLTNIIDEYKETLSQNKDMLDTVIKLENDSLHVSIVDKIIEFEQAKEKLTKKLNDTKEKYEVRDEDFNKWKEDYLNIEDINKQLDDIATLADEKLNEIEELVNKSVNVTEIVERRMMGTLEILARTMIIMAMLKRNPMIQANVAMAGGTLATFNVIRHMINPDLGTRRRLVADITDYKDMIVSTKNDVENINQLINDSITDVDRMKRLFEKEFKEYQYDFPEYKELFDKLEKLEKEMIERRQNMSRISRELEYQYDKNNAKVKHYDNLSPM